MPGKIANTLSGDRLMAFCEELRAISGKPTYAQAQTLAAKYGVPVSIEGAKTFVKGTFADHLNRIHNGREKAKTILSVVKEGGAHPLDAVEEAASADLLDLYTSGEEVDTAAIVKVALQLRASIESRKDRDRLDADLARRVRESESKMQINEQNRLIAEERAKKLEREREQWEAAQKKVAAATEQLRSATPEDADAVRARVVDLLDDVLGIKPKK